MIEANRQLKDYEKVGGKTRVAAPVKIRRPRLVGLPAAPGFAMGAAHVVGTFMSTIDRNLRARDMKAEQKRLEEALARALHRARRAQGPHGADDGRLGSEDFRRPSA